VRPLGYATLVEALALYFFEVLGIGLESQGLGLDIKVLLTRLSILDTKNVVTSAKGGYVFTPVCLFICWQDISKSYEWGFMKLSGTTGHV
jgi:hypothetical protein